MKTSTPFLPHLAGWLFGRPPPSIQARMQAQAQRIHRASLGKLCGLFAQYIHEPLLEPTPEGAGSRQRLFSTRTTFWTFLAQVLSPHGSCREALRKLQAWQAANELSIADANTSGYCQARARLPMSTLRQLHQRVVAELQRRTNQPDAESARPVKVVDGTCVSMPDTSANQALWPQTKGQKPGCGFPFAKLLGLFSLSNGVLIDWVEGNKHDHDNKLFRRLWSLCQPGDILVGDSAFCSYAAIAELQRRGIDSVMRIHQARKFDFRKGKPLGRRDRLITWIKPVQRQPGWTASQWNRLPDTLSIRLVQIQIQQPGFRVQQYVLVTTLLDSKQWSVQKLARLYFRRWAIELFFRDIKISLGMDILRCKTPQMVRKEIILHVIAYNCIRGVMQHVAALYQSCLERLSFKGTVDTLRQWAEALQIQAGKPRKQSHLLEVVFRIIAEDRVPYRPERSEPRVKKRRSKSYQLMTKPRAEMVVAASRRWK